MAIELQLLPATPSYKPIGHIERLATGPGPKNRSCNEFPKEGEVTADESRKIETTSTQLVYENRWMRVREDTIRRRDGSNGIYGVVEKPDFVVIIPVEDDGRLYLVEQFRYLVKAAIGNFPKVPGNR